MMRPGALLSTKISTILRITNEQQNIFAIILSQYESDVHVSTITLYKGMVGDGGSTSPRSKRNIKKSKKMEAFQFKVRYSKFFFAF